MEEIIEFAVKKIIQETPDAATFVLENVAGFPVPYQPGQFLTLLIERGGRELRRSYSICTTPGIDTDLAITIKRVPNGEVSRYLLNTVREGDVLRCLYPAGRFVLPTDNAAQRDIFLIGAGSGITPLYSILKSVLRNEPRSHVTLLYSNRDRETTLFWDALQTLQQQYPEQLTCIHLLSDPSPAWTGYRGRMKNELLEQLVRNHLRFARENALFYLCGPMDYMRTIRITLIFLGFSKDQIRKENFVTEPLLRIAQLPPLDTAPRNVTLHYRNQVYSFAMPGNQTLLQAALDQQIALPYSCRGGACATCAARCTQGKVHMTINDVLTDREVADGWILTCVGYPLSEAVIIEVDGK